MSDVFISYASGDRPVAQALAAELQARGLSVWWDRSIPPGRQFDEVIEEALDAARCVVLLWSPAAAASSWVKTEGAEALRKGLLVPALIAADVRIPLEFRRVQAADLSGWHAGEASPEFEQFHAAVVALVGGGVSPAPPPRPRPSPAPAPLPPSPAPSPSPAPWPAPAPGPAARWKMPRWGWAALAVVALAMVWQAFEEPASAPGVMPMPVLPYPSGQAVPASPGMGLDVPLRWRDDALNYEGRLRWDGRSTMASVALRAADAVTGRVVAEGTQNALLLPDGPTRMAFSMQVPVPQGDSRTPGSHMHTVNLVFEQTQPGGGWVFRRNCTAAGRPDLCYE